MKTREKQFRQLRVSESRLGTIAKYPKSCPFRLSHANFPVFNRVMVTNVA